MYVPGQEVANKNLFQFVSFYFILFLAFWSLRSFGYLSRLLQLGGWHSREEGVSEIEILKKIFFRKIFKAVSLTKITGTEVQLK